ncbi:MAG: hypothetical protein IPJ60_19040 [Sphingobacteriaceae bacterium]|nr:hypothetical protein [Sphingobacteriaceae bacterium]
MERKKEFEGGALYTQASHFIDLLVWWFGDLIESKNYGKHRIIESETKIRGSL